MQFDSGRFARLSLLPFQRTAVHVGAHGFGFGPLLLLLSVRLVHWARARAAAHLGAAAAQVFDPGTGCHGNRFQTEQTGVDGSADRPGCWTADNAERAGLGRSGEAPVLDAVSGVRAEEALFAAGVEAVLPTRRCPPSNGLDGNARRPGAFSHGG